MFAKDLENGDVALSVTNMSGKLLEATFDFTQIPALDTKQTLSMQGLMDGRKAFTVKQSFLQQRFVRMPHAKQCSWANNGELWAGSKNTQKTVFRTCLYTKLALRYPYRLRLWHKHKEGYSSRTNTFSIFPTYRRSRLDNSSSVSDIQNHSPVIPKFHRYSNKLRLLKVYRFIGKHFSKLQPLLSYPRCHVPTLFPVTSHLLLVSLSITQRVKYFSFIHIRLRVRRAQIDNRRRIIMSPRQPRCPQLIVIVLHPSCSLPADTNIHSFPQQVEWIKFHLLIIDLFILCVVMLFQSVSKSVLDIIYTRVRDKRCSLCRLSRSVDETAIRFLSNLA